MGDDGGSGDEASSCKSHRSRYSTLSRASTQSVRAADLRLRQLEEKQKLERQAEETRRQLELAKARHELELAELEQEREPVTGEDGSARSFRASSRHVTQCEPTSFVEHSSRTDMHGVPARQLSADRRPSEPVFIIKENPKLDILQFDGKFSRYPFFRLQVDEAMDSGQFTDVQIVRHLRDRLKGPAFEAVHGALLSGCSLARILHVLETRFGNRLQVTNDVTKQLLSFGKISSNDIERLAQFGTAVYNAISTLQAVGFESELDNLRTLQLLAEKLPLESQQAWGAYARRRCEDGRRLSCDLFHEFLEENIKDRQYSVVSCSLDAPLSRDMTGHNDRHESKGVHNEYKRDSQDGRRDRRHSRQHRQNGDFDGKGNRWTAEQSSIYTATAKGSAVRIPARQPVRCFFCGQDHYIARCQPFQGLSLRDRLAWVDAQKSCIRCLSTAHQTADCHRTRPCGRNNCGENHHHLLHPLSGNTTVVNAAKNGQTSVLMKTVVIEVSGARTRKCVAFLDEGSSVTLMTDQLAREIGLQGKRQSLRIKTMTGLTTVDSWELAQVAIRNIHTGSKHLLENVSTVPELQIDKNPVTPKQLKRMFPHIESVGIEQLDEPPQMLIGLDHAELIATQQIIRTTRNGPLLQETKLGWSITGRVVSNEDTKVDNVNFLNKASNAFAYDGDVSAPFSSDSDHSAIYKAEGADNLSAI